MDRTVCTFERLISVILEQLYSNNFSENRPGQAEEVISDPRGILILELEITYIPPALNIEIVSNIWHT
jgi:hypothetical protein